MGARMVEKERGRLLKKMEKQNKSSVLEPVKDDKRPSTISRTSTKTLKDNSSDSLTERQRREQEFGLMRKIQEDAATRRRWTSLLISGSTWFGIWFVGAAVFQATEYGQDWTYFGSLYFAYTSLLTIGYGDFYPQSNSGKPFFVFWSLLAIPSLTILISNMGDTIVKFIRDITIWIGNFTVLPGEQGVKATLKQSANQLTRGRFFDDEISETPPGLLGESNKRSENETDEDGDGDGDGEGTRERKNDPESAAQRVAGDKATRETKRAKKQGEEDDKLPKSTRHYHCILIKEIGKVMKHIHSSPPRKYTFDEWAWYLKLIGEDESNADTHRKALRKPRPDGEGLGAAMMDEDRSVKWSWVGNRSPLMGNKEEAEWVLERLTATLDRELEQIRREELENEEKGDEDGRKGVLRNVKHEMPDDKSSG
jgi:potassium channel subfamily K